LNSTYESTAKVAEELNQSNENGDSKKEANQHTEARSGESLKMGQQSNAWPVYKEYGYTAYW